MFHWTSLFDQEIPLVKVISGSQLFSAASCPFHLYQNYSFLVYIKLYTFEQKLHNLHKYELMGTSRMDCPNESLNNSLCESKSVDLPEVSLYSVPTS